MKAPVSILIFALALLWCDVSHGDPAKSSAPINAANTSDRILHPLPAGNQKLPSENLETPRVGSLPQTAPKPGQHLEPITPNISRKNTPGASQLPPFRTVVPTRGFGTIASGNVPVRRPMLQPAGPLLDNVQNRGPAPAVIGGVPAANIKSAGTLNGTTINRKP
jgi:hypothetical protein